MHLLILLLTVSLSNALPPGLYRGACEAGRVDLELQEGWARFGGLRYAAKVEGATLVLEREGQTLRLRVEPGPVLLGPPYGRVLLQRQPERPAPPRARPDRPADLRGAWRHQASGGSLTLVLGAEGDYTMRQTGAEDTMGTWRGDAEGITLLPRGGHPQRYRARRKGARLFVSGGDLPGEVAFEPEVGPDL